MTQAIPFLELVDVSRAFVDDDTQPPALSHIDLTIERGQYVAVCGPSGCGKSTLLSILGLLDAPSSGRYLLDGVPVQDLGAAERSRMRSRYMGFIFQAFNLVGELSVYENVELPLLYRPISPAERRQRVERALERVAMAHRARHRPGQLSGGQQQRVAVARALVGDPELVLADEPTGNLDSLRAAEVMELIDDLHRGGATICLVTHDPRFAERAQRSIHLFDGRLVGRTGLAQEDSRLAAAVPS